MARRVDVARSLKYLTDHWIARKSESRISRRAAGFENTRTIFPLPPICQGFLQDFLHAFARLSWRCEERALPGLRGIEPGVRSMPKFLHPPLMSVTTKIFHRSSS